MIATWREIVTRTTEYLIPRNAAIGELGKAIAHAWVAYCTDHGIDPDTARQWDDWATVDHDDDHIIIRFTRQEPDRG